MSLWHGHRFGALEGVCSRCGLTRLQTEERHCTRPTPACGKCGRPWDATCPCGMRVLYLAHPVSGDVPGNLLRARRWLRWAQTAFSSCVVIAPWILALELGDDDANPEHRERGLARDEAVVARCDAVLLVGGRVSEGMAREAKVAKAVVDLTWMGVEP
jgi:hypothetical protein